jgi:uncharacterized protein
MTILVDIEHPAHVHYFKNLISLLQLRGHNVVITAIDKDITFELLEKYNLKYYSLGKHYPSIHKKLIALIRNELKLFFISLKTKPDLYISFHSPYPAHIGWLFRKKVIGITDTEHAKISNQITNPFTNIINTPFCFQQHFGKKHRKFNGYIELCYLHPKYFSPDNTVLKLIGVKDNEKYSILRFISWGAIHDIGHSGINMITKRRAIAELSRFGKVFISSEGELPKDLEKYRLKIPIEKIHDILYYASLYFGESGTMATESAILGTPAIRVSTLAKLLGNFKELNEEYDLLYYYDNGEEGLNKCLEIIANNDSKQLWKEKAQHMINEKTDINGYLLDQIELAKL